MACKVYRKLLVDKNPRNGGQPQTNSYIVIHNIGYGKAAGCWDWFYKCLHGQGRDGIACQYTIDDKEGFQMLEDNWGAGHTRGDGHYKGFDRDPEGKINNGNAIGIEVGDKGVDIDLAVENCIELVRHLMQCYNIPIENVVRHGDTQDKFCPEVIMKNNKWDYMLDEIQKRNAAQKPIDLDVSELKTADMTCSTGNSGNSDTGNTGGSGGGGTLELTFHDTTTVQESLPNANVSDNWVDMHKIKGITMHMYPPYHDCTADSMAKYFKSLGWNRNFHYKVDKDTKIDFDKKPVSGQTTGGNVVGSSRSDFEVTPKDPLYSGVVLGGGGYDYSGDTNQPVAGNPIDGNDVAHKVYNYCVSQGCSMAAACGIVGNCERESTFQSDLVNSIGCSGLFQWKDERLETLRKKASAAGKEWTDVDIQIQYMWEEWSGSYYTGRLKKQYGKTLDQYKQMTDPKECARIFDKVFEISGDKTDKRATFAQKWYDQFQKESQGQANLPEEGNSNTDAPSGSGSSTVARTSMTSAGYKLSLLDGISLLADTEGQNTPPFGWPVPTQSYIQSYYGYRSDTLGYNYHPGIDIVCYAGSGAYSYAGGTVAKVLEDTKLKNYIRIDHGNGIQTAYGSLDTVYVKEGDKVFGGQCIGTTATTVSNPLMHLHFEMIIDGEHVDPLIYVAPGGGNASIPENYYGVMTLDMSDTSDNVTWDNIDKGKICFASADNNTHTYIDANLFNNQHPKYTLSIGAFFYDEFDLVEKTGNVDYPNTERVLIQQCAKALYDEGFTSKQLWREFDLNRAPSPFLYLDKNKWIAFCKEVDKQVEWLNTKYGKVKSTYVPNELLQDQNDNKFIETAPDGGIQQGSSGGNAPGNTGGGPANINGALFIGDSWGVGIEPLVEAESGISEACGGKDYLYYYNPSRKTDRLKGMKKDPTFIYIYLGLNNMKRNSENGYVDKFYQRVKEVWPNTHVYVGKLMHAGKAWTGNKYNEYGNVDDWNKAADEMNKRIEILCQANGFTLIDVSSGLMDSDGYLNESLATSDGLHLKNWQTYFDNIKNAIGQYENTSPSTGDGGQKGSGNFIWPVPGHSRISSPFGPRKAPTKGASTYHRGIDIPAPTGTPVVASDGGKVVIAKTGYNGGRGTYVVIDHGNGKGTLYQHLNKFVVNVGNSVSQGTKIAEVGNTGIGTGSHLHFEVHESFSGTKGTPVNPQNYVSPGKSTTTRLLSTNTQGGGSSLYIEGSNEYGTIYTLKAPKAPETTKPETPEEPPKDDKPEFTASKDNIGRYCYVSNTKNETNLLKKAKDDASVVASLAVGDELHITGVDKTYYKCTFGKKTGYVSESSVVVIKKGHGDVNPGYVGSNCWIRYENTDFYKDTDMKSNLDDLSEQDFCVILAVDKNLGLYKIEGPKKTGWVKAYAVTFDPNEFKTAIDNTTNSLTPDNKDTNTDNPSESTPEDPGASTPEKPPGGSATDKPDKPEKPEDEKDEEKEVVTTIEITNGDFESGSESWDKEGDIEFAAIDNPEWGTEGHWPYHGKGYARIRNNSKKLAGIKNTFKISNKEKKLYIRILFYVKQVTQDDFNNGPLDPDSLKSNGITVKLLDKNKKVKHTKKINLDGISNTTWNRVGCVISDLKLEEYTLLIGDKKLFDLLIDDVTIEQVDLKSINQAIGDSNTTSGIIISGAGATAIDNGGTMIYEVGKPTDKNAKQPEIKTVITQKEYEEIMQYSKAAYIDQYTNSFEPYDKDLPEAKTVGLNADSRLEVLTEEMKTFTDNMIRYKVVETGPGSIDHCVKPVDELNVLYKNVECKVDPIYPDLVIPPKYVTSTYDQMSKNSIPLTTVEDVSLSMEDALDKSYSYDYELLNKKTKKSKGKPINYYDPYPYDDKITDLENHYPKVLIDEVESRLYSCNHPGCPIAHPMAKNFAMLSDMAINQSKATEQRLVRLENTLSTVVRYLGRMGSRMNINCVYYGGQDTLSKYKCIRCLRDDRVHDGATVTIDQCLTCTRYEPIIGQIYDILDETGFNGSAILDDMQMSYMSLNDFKNLNDVDKRSSRYSYINTNRKEKKKPKSLIDDWLKEDKDKAIKDIKKKEASKKKQKEKIESLTPSDYLFIMDWTEESVDLQQPDVKVYPTEKIAAKYKNQAGDPGEDTVASAEKSTQMGTDKKTYNLLASGEWVDTRERDDSVQINKYTSLDFYFENFNLNRTGYEYDNGLKGNVGLTYSGGQIGNAVNGNGAEIRKKITEMAMTIVQEHKDGKACYSNDPRTIDHDKPQKINGTKCGMTNPIGYDCTSLVSCCYKAAGLSDFYDGRTGQGNVAENTLVQEVLKKGGKIWFADTEGMAQALPGDVLMTYKHAPLDKNKIADGSGCKATHAIIYMGDGMIAHSSEPKPAPEGIRYEKADYYVTGKHAGHSFFLRPQSLIDADAAQNSNGGTGPDETAGTIDGINYVCKLGQARCTEYGTWDGSEAAVASGKPWSQCLNQTVASHNLPYGTKLYIPGLKGKVNNTGMFTVEDTGGYTFDFDVCTSKSYNITGFYEAYIISYGTSKSIAESFTKMRQVVDPNGTKFANAWNEYMKHGGCLIKFNKFSSVDANATWWKK